ncbi:MAG: hypothetical protein JW750_08620 [Anaerolineaceae bacterium]|nr:hypothetical protein [Anaerolineaceae bacterium]
MAYDSISPFEFILSAMPVVVVLLMALFYLLGRVWRNAAEMRVKESGARLREAEYALKEVRHQLRTFESSAEHSPYQFPYTQAETALENAVSWLRRDYRAYADLMQEIKLQLRATPRNVVLGPYLWNRTQRRIRRLDRDQARTELQIEEAKIALSGVRNAGRETAQDARTSWQSLQELSDILEHLAERQIHGEVFDRVRSRYGPLRKELEQVPAHFLNLSAEDEDFDGAQEEVIRVHGILNETRAELRGLLHDAKRWQKEYEEAQEMIQMLEKLLRANAKKLAELPAGVDSSGLLAELNQQRGRERELSERLKRLKADDLRYVLRESRQSLRIGDAFLKQIEQIGSLHEELTDLRAETNEWWTEVEKTYTHLTHSPFLPLEMDQSAELFGDLRMRIGGVLPAHQSRTLDQINEEIEILKASLLTLKEFKPDLEAMKAGQAELMVQIRRLRGDEMINWQRQALEDLALTESYAEENYTAKYGDGKFDPRAALSELSQAAEKTLPELKTTILESELFNLMRRANLLDQQRSRLEEAIRERKHQFEALQESERDGQARLSAMRQSMASVDEIARLDVALRSMTGSTLNRYQKQLDRLAESAEASGSGNVRDRLEEIERMERQLRGNLVDWLEQYDQLSEHAMQVMRDDLAQIHECAVITDEIVGEARSLSEHQTERHLKAKPADDDSLEEISAQFALIYQSGAKLRGVSGKIHDLREQVSSSHQRVEQARSETESQLAGLEARFEPGSWSQAALSAGMLRKELASLQKQYERFQSESNPGQRFARRSTDFLNQYQSIQERIGSIREELERGEKLVLTAESRLDMTLSLWTQVQNYYSGDRSAQNGIETILQTYRRRYEAERARHQNGGLTDEAYIQMLRRLDEQLNDEQAQLDSGKTIDINGEELG